MQIYKGMDIGTAKPTVKERQEIPHHLFDLVDPDEEFSASAYKELALKTIKEIKDRGKNPILVGGTGLYLSSLYYDYSFRSRNDDLKKKYTELYEKNGITALQEEAKKLSEEEYEKIDKDNPHRLLRFLESQGEIGTRTRSALPLFVVYLEFPPEELHERIKQRILIMHEEGLLDEVKAIYERYGHLEYLPALKGIGYKEFYPFFRGECSLDEAIERQIIHTRQYAKRQRTWGRNQYEDLFKLDGSLSLHQKIAQIEQLWR